MKQTNSGLLVMPGRYALLKRSHGVYSAHERATGKRISLKTRDHAQAVERVNAMNQDFADRQHAEALARIYQEKAGRTISKVTWGMAMEECWNRSGLKAPTVERLKSAFSGKEFVPLRSKLISETYGEDLREILKNGPRTTAKFLRTLQCFVLDRGWLSMPLVPNKLMRVKKVRQARAITLEEHQRILATEKKPEWRRYYSLLWLVGGAQSDVANLRVENFNKETGVLTYVRQKTGCVCRLRWNRDIGKLLELLPEEGWVFPTIRLLPHNQRASEFWRRARTKKVNIQGVSLHSYRYAWAERAAKAGLSIRECQVALGHRSEAVHLAYARHADIVCSPLPEGSENLDWDN